MLLNLSISPMFPIRYMALLPPSTKKFNKSAGFFDCGLEANQPPGLRAAATCEVNPEDGDIGGGYAADACGLAQGGRGDPE